MIASALLLALLAATPLAGEGLDPAPAQPVLHLTLVPPEPRAPLPSAVLPGSDGAPPPCAGDVCQPRVAVPGFEPQLSLRGKRTELVLALLDRAHVEPLATAVWMLAATGVRVDYSPPQFDRGGLSSGHGGWGHFQVLVRWRLDASSAPVWPVRGR